MIQEGESGANASEDAGAAVASSPATRGKADHQGRPGAAKAKLVPIAAFARIKPLDVDRASGASTTKRIAAWDQERGTIEMAGISGGRKSTSDGRQTFDHTAIFEPDAPQSHVYDVIAAPLVQAFLNGFDVDLLTYGQTGSGKTFTMFGPPHSMAHAAEALPSDGPATTAHILRDEHGLILRCGFEILAAMTSLIEAGSRAVLHGSMVELSIFSLTNQSVSDLLNGMAPCYVDDNHHLQGARQVPLRTAADIVSLASAVEQRLTRGTRMNDTSSRSHCITTFTLIAFDGESVRESRFQFFDLMGSERFEGQNAAHDNKQSSKATMAGWEGIFANMSLTGLMSAVDLAAQARRSRRKAVVDSVMCSFLLTKLLMGSLTGPALTGMITCVSQAPRNGEETYLSLKYGSGMAKLLNAPSPQPEQHIDAALSNARKQLASAMAVLAKGVRGKYQALREAQVSKWAHAVDVLEKLQGDIPPSEP